MASHIIRVRKVKNWTYNILQICSILSLVHSEDRFQFDKDYVGVVFSPHVKNLEGSTYPAWNNYTVDEVETMLLLVSSRFRTVSTFGMGATGKSESWKNGDAVGFTGMAAAYLNANKSSTVISAILGVWKHENKHLLNSEISKAFNIAKEANNIHAQTVWGVTLTSEYVTNNATVYDVLKMIADGKSIMGSTNSVKIGVRLSYHICLKLINTTDTHVKFLHVLIKSVDYILCLMFPPREPAGGGPQNAAKLMMGDLDAIRDEMHEIKPNVMVIGETGWPSSGIHHDMVASTFNMVKYWEEISRIAKEGKLHVNMFAAIDEPWKNKVTNPKEAYDGPCGSDGHFGWWRRKSNAIASLDAYVEKIQEPQIPSCEEAEREQQKHREQKRKEEDWDNKKTLITWIIVSLLFFIIALAVFLYFLYLKLKKSKAEKLTEEEIAEFEKGMVETNDAELENIEIALRLPYDRKFELEKGKFVINKDCVLGSGEFGIVYKGKIQDSPTEVAFKTTKPRCPVENLKSFLAEIKLMIYIGEHMNIVGLVGAFTGDIRDGEVYIASELCTIGSLEKFLRSAPKVNYANLTLHSDNVAQSARYVNSPDSTTAANRKPKEIVLSMPNLLKWSYHIACGMDFLSSKKVVHADLATRNVLLNENGTAKITDFGLSRKMYAYTNYVKKKQEPLPWRWMAIESLRKLHFSSQSDVWSYGVTLWEIFSFGDIPYPGLAWDVDFVTQLERGLRLKKPKDASEEVYKFMWDCWKIDPKERPKFSALATYFGGLFKNVEVNGDYHKLSDT